MRKLKKPRNVWKLFWKISKACRKEDFFLDRKDHEDLISKIREEGDKDLDKILEDFQLISSDNRERLHNQPQ